MQIDPALHDHDDEAFVSLVFKKDYGGTKCKLQLFNGKSHKHTTVELTTGVNENWQTYTIEVHRFIIIVR